MNRHLRVLIVDDEPLARLGVRQLLARHPGCVVVGECRNGREALRRIEEDAPDLVFLDVQMPELDGLGVVRERGPGRMPAVVFVTAYDEYAVRAFEAHAVDYLVKPVSEERFAAALARVRERLAARGALARARRLEALLAEAAARRESAPPRPAERRRLVVATAAGQLVLDAAEVDWIGADDYYAVLHVGGRRHLLRESLSSLARRLAPSAFLRVHRSALVNVERVRELRTAGGRRLAILRDGSRVPVSRRRYGLLADLLRGR